MVSPLSSFLAATAAAVVSAKDVYYEWTIQPRLSVPPLSPDCYTDRDLLLVDDQFPSPTLRANVGDTLHIMFHNYHPSEAVSIHYHGLLMQDQPFSDGTSGVSTCAVGPMQTFEHVFVADNAGTHYWHGHTSMDRMDGLQGLIVIEDPNDPQEQALKEMYDDERVLFLQDWYHKSGPSLRTTLDSGVWIGSPQSILINGKGQFAACVEDPAQDDCDEACSDEDYIPAIPVEAGKTYLFRVINAGGLMSLNLAFANHTMTVVKADGNFVEPVDVTSLEVNLAQRYSVLVSMDQEENMSYWAAAHPGRGSPGWTYLQYNNATAPNENYTMPEHDMDGFALDSMLFSKSTGDHPDADILTEDAVPDRSSVIVTAQSLHPGTGKRLYTSNNVSNTLHSPKPLAAVAYEALMDDASAPWPDTVVPGTIGIPDEAPLKWNYSNTPRVEGLSPIHLDHGMAVFQFVKGEIVEMVFQNTVGGRGTAGNHGWHLHGHEFYVIGQGTGTFEETDRASFNLENPVLRDTFSTWGLGWTAIRFRAKNPGVWPFHCTMLPHSISGMGFNVITSPDLLTTPPPGLTSCMMTSLNSEDAQTCMPTSEFMNLTASMLELEVARAGDGEGKSGVEESTKNEDLDLGGASTSGVNNVGISWKVLLAVVSLEVAF